MTYADDILSKDNHKIGYRITFDGVAEELSTHSSIAGITPGSTVYPVILGPPQGSSSSLDRSRSMIMPGGFTVEVAATSTIKEYFARTGGVEGTLKDSIDAKGATDVLEFNEGLIYSAGQNVYIEKETVTLGPIAGFTYTGCTRGAPAVNKSEQQGHASGAIVSDRPRFWLGRRATLYAVDLETGNAGAVRTGFLSSSPTFNNGVYGLSFVDMQSALNRKIFMGWKSQGGIVSDPVMVGDNQQFDVTVPDIREFSVLANSYVKVTFENSFAIFKCQPINVHTLTSKVTLVIRRPTSIQGDLVGWGGAIDFSSNSAVSEFFGQIPDDSVQKVSIQTVCLVVGSPAYCALQIMNSRNGDLTNGPYDQLPGVSLSGTLSTEDQVPKRCGAGLPHDWIDDLSWLEQVGGQNVVMLLEEPTDLLDFLENEIAWILGGYLYVNEDGQLGFQKYLPAVPSASLDFYDDGDIINMSRSIVDDESEIIAGAIIECDYDYSTSEYRKRIEVSWPTTIQTYGESRAQLHFSSKTVRTIDSNLNVNLSSAVMSEEQLRTSMDRIYSRTRNGCLKIQISVPWKYSQKFKPGYLFKLNDQTLPAEGTTGFIKQFETTGIQTNYEAGRVIVDAEEQPRGWLIAPACFCDSVAPGPGGVTFVTIDLTGDEALLFDADPGSDFIPGCTVRIYQAAAVPPFSTSGTGTVAGTLPSVLTIGPFPTVAPAAGDLIVLEVSANTGNTNSTGADVDDHLFCGDSTLHPPSFFGGLLNRWG